MPSVTLLTIGGDEPRPGWTGPQVAVAPTPSALEAAMAACDTDGVLCLDAGLDLPAPDLVPGLLAGPCDAWHGGLRLGWSSRSTALDHVQPQWMFAAPADGDVEVTSHLVSLRALLVRREVVDQLGGPDPTFGSLPGAGFELGLRWLRAGALVRHHPGLVPAGSPLDPPADPRDELRAVSRHQGRAWGGWALARSVVRRRIGPVAATRLVGPVRREPPAPPTHFRARDLAPGSLERTVSVVLPTVDRYAYLEPLLVQLARQTVPPHEVLVVDQTPADRRRDDLEAIAPDLPVRVTVLDVAGQSTARNAALTAATGELLLFVDDDDEIPDDLIESHLRRLGDGVDACCGAVDDATAGPPPPGFRHRRASDVFPTNNTMLRRRALARSGLFDPAYDRGSRADRDLGLRLHLTGAVLVYDPTVSVFHHHAPRGGLRTHGARAVTRASSRSSLTQRHLPSATELYQGRRYFTPDQCREARAIRLLSTFSGGGGPAARALRAALQVALLPSTIAHLRRTEREADRMLADRPPIPELPAPTAPR